jgi:hypothetical protein
MIAKGFDGKVSEGELSNIQLVHPSLPCQDKKEFKYPSLLPPALQ